MDELLDEIRTILPAAFETDDYRVRRQAVESTFQQRQDGEFSRLQEEAVTKGLNLLRTPEGLIFAPMRDGEVLKTEDFQKMTPAEQETIKTAIEEMQEKLKFLRHEDGTDVYVDRSTGKEVYIGRPQT